jgi:nitroreductase
VETYEALRRRRMVRAFEDREVPREALARVLEAGRRAPSAGFSQGVELLVLETAGDREAFWEAATDAAWRAAHPRHEQTRRAPVIVVPLTGPGPYVERYSEPDKAGSGLDDEAGWPVPFWWVDAGFAVMAMLLAAVDEGLGALFMGVFRGEEAVRRAYGLPEEVRPVGAVLMGWPAPDRPSPSLARRRRERAAQVHAGRYGVAWTG